jgi:rhodanese-related sulfurtransferase
MAQIAPKQEKGEIPRIPKDELRARLDDPETAVIDVRQEQSEATEKIRNAALEDVNKVDNWADKYPKDKSIILYCS